MSQHSVDVSPACTCLLQRVNRRLMEEQDAEYQRSLEADREREAQRQAAGAADKQSKRAAEEEAAKARSAACLPMSILSHNRTGLVYQR